MQFIAFDSHKHYTLARVESSEGTLVRQGRIEHQRGAICAYLRGCERGSPVAVETVGNWYWIVREIEDAGMVPRLVHARKAKLLMGQVNKTDKLDVQGLNRLQRVGALPVVWIPPDALRDRRELPRTRMTLVHQRTQLKNRIHATLAKYALTISEVTDIFGVRGREILRERLGALPPETRYVTEMLLKDLEFVEEQIEGLEARVRQVLAKTPEIEILMTLPGVGFTLAVVIVLEVGAASRFPTASHLASYAGTTPRVHSSGGKTRYGPLRSDVNHYLKWAFVEAGNAVSRFRRRWPDRHVSRLYERIRARKGHPKAIGAVARHLAEAAYWVLTKNEPYRPPASSVVSSTKAQARMPHEPPRLGD